MNIKTFLIENYIWIIVIILITIITIIGFKISSKKADKDHPFGHQRFEYITGLIISFIILMIGNNQTICELLIVQ